MNTSKITERVWECIIEDPMLRLSGGGGGDILAHSVLINLQSKK
jgi:hypothetical protein